ncbi:hypothetical protein [Erwinia pyrifoliae]|uniref:hypothetical protein n=1 Tax=Erwinia pyrifoliae TaxID=79967 RepID=UPI00223B55E9|nr:hypothetical protein [Erwinia pyrifoliae]MCT2386413.1 hypothetical protein [Erwinia pyrifoliae]MCU8587990.1 hypothetical protein [Erwinia pyrifoliae]
MLRTSGNVNNGANAPLAVNQVESGRADLISGEKDILQKILSVSITDCQHSRNGSTQTMESRSVPDLQMLATSATLGKMQEPGDLNRIARLIYTLAPGLEPSLVQFAGDKLAQVTMMIAKKRVMNGELWDTVAREHSITEEQDTLELQMIVVDGSARERVMRGQHCGEVSELFKINHILATIRLQRIAVDGPASKSVQKGEHCAIVANRHGIEHSLAILELQMAAVNSYAKQRIDEGVDWAVVAKKCGITHVKAFNYLHQYALRAS